MSKALSDILGRLNGDMLALAGLETKLAPPPAAPPPTVAQEAWPPPPVSPKEKMQEYEYAKKLLDEVSSLAKSASEEIDRELKVPPPPPEAESPPSSAPASGGGAHKAK